MNVRQGIWCTTLLVLLARVAIAAPQYAFRITFTDKKGAPSILNPQAFLSQRSLDRRNQQGLSVDSTDRPVSPLYLDTVLTLTQGVLHVTSRWLNNCVILVDDASKVAPLHSKPYISSITEVANYPNGLHNLAPGVPVTTTGGNGMSIKAKTTGDPTYYGSTWGQTSLVKGDCLHDNGWKGEGKLIAVLDDGFRYVDTAAAFDSMHAQNRLIEVHNFISANNDVFSQIWVHGTEVLSTMAGLVPNTYVGAATHAQFALYVTEDQSGEKPIEMDNMVAAFERADSIGADVISSSLGYNTFEAPYPNITPAEMDGKTTVAARGANLAAQKGILLVITAGNEGSGGLLTPGDADSVITVGNVDNSKNPAPSSGYGPNAAGIIKPEVCAQGNLGYVMTSNLAPFGVQGTSISTPQLAGFAACLWQGSPGRTNSEIKRAIIRSAHLYPNPQMPQLGYGVPDFCAASTRLDIKGLGSSITGMAVQPNPFYDYVSIKVSSNVTQDVVIAITDVTGKLVMSQPEQIYHGENAVSLDLSSFASGIYICRVVGQNAVQTVKLVKQ